MSAVLDGPSAAGVLARHPSAGTDRTTLTRHLIAAMMVGQMHGLHEDAQAVFAGVSCILGDARQLRITLAFASAVGADTAPAHALLDEGIDDWPDSELAKVSLALALKISGDLRWQEIVDRALIVNSDAATRLFAQNVQNAFET